LTITDALIPIAPNQTIQIFEATVFSFTLNETKAVGVLADSMWSIEAQIFYPNGLDNVALQSYDDSWSQYYTQNAPWVLGPGNYQLYIFEEDGRIHPTRKKGGDDSWNVNVTLIEGLSACTEASSLGSISFCTSAQDYVIPINIYVTSADSNAESDFYTFTDIVYPGASDECISAVKSYICSFWFPTCDQNGLIQQNCRKDCLALAEACGGSPCLEYICTEAISYTDCNATVTYSMTQTAAGKTTPPSSSSGSTNVGAIVGGILAGLCICMSILGAAFWYRRKKKKEEEEAETETPMTQS